MAASATGLLAALGDMPLFSGVPEESLLKLADDFQEFSVLEGRIIVEQGEESRDFYVVLSGGVIGLLITEGGRQVSFTEMGAGRYFGELSALDGSPRSITVSASERSRIARLNNDAFQDWLEREPRILRNIAIDLAARTRVLNERVIGLIVHDVETRVRMLLVRLAQEREQLIPEGVIHPAPTHEQMATYVGANREAVSRVVARLSKEGVITSKRQKVIIHRVGDLLEGL
ncbi:Crp/Fnr family transcriptional regulator (plasmid) [Rhodobacteraceae bacterium SC52]|uniref:Crp/Fnr family transcriptional regulator n=2 Tax=Meridianimarinicoccus aquatilis TaxID=2552766 RepID=A0A4R6B2J5_9RHOB|nr:Crp/Fnr family transcriptional regulator [Rhodobacteraceae bacterium SC52]TDL90462.1 Crp/Fnr family transcriptional regulator [Fluviibacterium aquatile]